MIRIPQLAHVTPLTPSPTYPPQNKKSRLRPASRHFTEDDIKAHEEIDKINEAITFSFPKGLSSEDCSSWQDTVSIKAINK